MTWRLVFTGAVAHEKVIRVSTAEVAESGKLLENIFRSVNIALVSPGFQLVKA